jgi:hypothetical protein
MLGDKATSSVMMSAINGNENLQSDLNAYAMAKMNGDDTLFDKYVDGAYDSSADFWKLNRDGTLSFDGNADLYDENGNLIYKSTSRGIQGSLSEILKISSDDAYDLMKSAGMIWDGKTWLNEKNATDGSHVIGMEAKTAGGITYESLYKSVQITDVITGITGTLEKQNPLNIYNTMVATGLMEMGWVFSYDRIEGSFDVTQAPISYEKYKANNFMYSPGYYMISLKDPVNVKHAADDFFGSRINPTDSSKTHNHTATDYGVPEGTPFKPYAEGTVSKVATTDGGGNTLTTNFLYLP